MIEVFDDDGEPIKLPTRFEVCPRCHGRGEHVNPSIDGHGISREEMDELGEEFEEDYRAGLYNITCTECQGLRVVEVLDETRVSAEQLAAYQAAEFELAEMRSIERMERRMMGGDW